MASKLKIIHAVIHFLWVKRCNCCEIYWQLDEVFGEKAMSLQAIATWRSVFENGQTDIDDAVSENRLSIATNSEMTAHVNECVLANRTFTIRHPCV